MCPHSCSHDTICLTLTSIKFTSRYRDDHVEDGQADKERGTQFYVLIMFN
jgi:hypothetical protein